MMRELPRFQYGGKFEVKGPSGIDKAMVAFRATKGETVTVRRPGEDEPAGGVTINAPIYVSAPDPVRFQASKERLEQKRLETIQRAIRSL